MAGWFSQISQEKIFLSVVTPGELREGIENIRRRDDAAAQALESWFQEIVADHSERILPIDQVVAEQWGRFNVPDPLAVIDSLNAATAKVHGLTLVTRTVKVTSRLQLRHRCRALRCV